MSFLTKLIQAIAFVPSIVTAVENFFQDHSSSEKKNAAMSFLQGALSMADAVSSKQIVDEVTFRNGLSKIVDGTVECLNASVWAKPQMSVPITGTALTQ